MAEVRSLPKIPARKADAHKGDCGRVLIVAGSLLYTGAAALAAEAAVRGGAGLVLVAVPWSVQPIVAAKVWGPIVYPMPETAVSGLALGALEPIEQLAGTVDVLAIGPGLSREEETEELVRRLVRGTKLPLVLDADGINAFAGRAEELGRRAGPTVLTPHPGEMARLTGREVGRTDKERLAAARELAGEESPVVLLKGHHTVVAAGRRHFINKTGNPGMATGGAGDVLTGLIAALIGQGMTPFDAAVLGAHLHGLAGDLAARELGEISLAPGDLLHHLPAAIKRHSSRKGRGGRGGGARKGRSGGARKGRGGGAKKRRGGGARKGRGKRGRGARKR